MYFLHTKHRLSKNNQYSLSEYSVIGGMQVPIVHSIWIKCNSLDNVSWDFISTLFHTGSGMMLLQLVSPCHHAFWSII